jgi:hypothetical protein
MDVRGVPCHDGRPLPRRCTTVEQGDQTSAVGESCPDCHALVADLTAHERWHSRLVSDIASAVVKEMQRTRAGSA